MDNFFAECTNDFYMDDNGALAFVKGTVYEWKWPTQEEFNELGAEYVFTSELGTDHFMSHEDVLKTFGPIDGN